jgi:hypothetical protein
MLKCNSGYFLNVGLTSAVLLVVAVWWVAVSITGQHGFINGLICVLYCSLLCIVLFVVLVLYCVCL